MFFNGVFRWWFALPPNGVSEVKLKAFELIGLLELSDGFWTFIKTSDIPCKLRWIKASSLAIKNIVIDEIIAELCFLSILFIEFCEIIEQLLVQFFSMIFVSLNIDQLYFQILNLVLVYLIHLSQIVNLPPILKIKFIALLLKKR